LRGFLTLDVPMDLFNSLIGVETFKEKLREVA